MKNIINQKHFIHTLKDSNSAVRKVLLKNATSEQRKAIMEIIVNILNGNVPLTSKQKNALSKHKNKLRNLCASCYKNKVINKRKIPVEQVGGALPFLIAPILALLGKAAAAGAVSAGASFVTEKVIDSATSKQ